MSILKNIVMPLHFITRDVCIIITIGIHEIEDFEVNCKPSGDLHGFGFAEMPPIIYGGKDEIKCNPLISCGVNNHWNTRNYRFRFLLKIKNYFTQI